MHFADLLQYIYKVNDVYLAFFRAAQDKFH